MKGNNREIGFITHHISHVALGYDLPIKFTGICIINVDLIPCDILNMVSLVSAFFKMFLYLRGLRRVYRKFTDL